MNVSVDDIKAIKLGEKRIFRMNHPRELQNVRALASYTHINYPELAVRFKSCLNRKKMEITIEAVEPK